MRNSTRSAGLRAALALAGVLAVVNGPAYAAAPARCTLLTDALGDATVYVGGVTPDGAGEGLVPSDASLDIASVDLGYTGRDLVATMRTAGLVTPDPQSPLGQYFAVAFRVAGEDLILDGVVTPLAQRAWVARADGSQVGGEGALPASIRIDAPHRTVTLVVSLAQLSRLAPARRGTRLTTVTALTQRVVGATEDRVDARALVGADAASTRRSYVIGTPTRC